MNYRYTKLFTLLFVQGRTLCAVSISGGSDAYVLTLKRCAGNPQDADIQAYATEGQSKLCSVSLPPGTLLSKLLVAPQSLFLPDDLLYGGSVFLPVLQCID